LSIATCTLWPPRCLRSHLLPSDALNWPTSSQTACHCSSPSTRWPICINTGATVRHAAVCRISPHSFSPDPSIDWLARIARCLSTKSISSFKASSWDGRTQAFRRPCAMLTSASKHYSPTAIVFSRYATFANMTFPFNFDAFEGAFRATWGSHIDQRWAAE
jgi:hypothetical protein